MKTKNGVLWIRSHSDIENSAQAHMKNRQLFLKWCLTNMLTVAIIFLATAFGATQTQNLSLIGKAMVLAIVMSNSLVGLGIALIPTITGVFFRSILSWQHHLIANEVTYVINGYKKGMKKR